MDREALQRIPASPGVYIMKDKKGRVLYVGKAKDLRARVRAYFRGGDDRAFVALGVLGRLLGDVETVVVNNEKEALLLENNLIKQYQPRFNVKLTDDKNYLVLRIDPRARYPRVEVVRGMRDDGARYFGPYHSATSARETLRLVNRHFQLRTCTDHVLNNRTRPCILHQIKRCPAPCVLPVDPAQYAEQVEDVCLFLLGKKDELVPRLRERMREHARRLEFERAAQIRDQIAAAEKTLTRQTVVSADLFDQDVIGVHRRGDVVEIVVLFMRQGKLLGRRAFHLRDQEVPDEDVLRDFVRGYYDLGSFIPDEVLLPVDIDDRELIAEWLGDTVGHRVQVLTPRRGPRRQLLELATKNAEASAASRKGRDNDSLAALEKLQRRLGLKRLPKRIECYDIAHIQGVATVASMVVFLDGEPAKSEYRTFKVKTATNDDFAAMYEVLSRRFRRARHVAEGISIDDDPRWAEPDLLVVDGGKGQLSTALAALRDVGWDLSGERGFDVIALAKARSAGWREALRARGRKRAAAGAEEPAAEPAPGAAGESGAGVGAPVAGVETMIADGRPEPGPRGPSDEPATARPGPAPRAPDLAEDDLDPVADPDGVLDELDELDELEVEDSADDLGALAGAEDAGAEDAGADDAGAEDAGADGAGAEDAGAEDAGADGTGAEDAGADGAGAEDANAEDVPSDAAASGRRHRDDEPGVDAPPFRPPPADPFAVLALADAPPDFAEARASAGDAGEHVGAAGGDVPDRVYLRNVKDPVPLRPNSTELFLLARIRDEAHRFANEFHARLRRKRTLRSALEEVPGVGVKRKRLLLRTFGSLKKIREASVDELAAAPGMTRKAAEAIKKFFGETPP